MTGLDITTDRAYCFKCGMGFPKKKGYFSACYSKLYKGLGYLPVCKQCQDQIYEEYLKESKDAKPAVRQFCRKFDIFWDEFIFDTVYETTSPRSALQKYLTKLSRTGRCHGKSYDDTLRQEGKLWDFHNKEIKPLESPDGEGVKSDEEKEEPVSDEIMIFWGTGYTPSMYRELEQRREYWMSKFPDGAELDIGTEAIIRQICSLELDINRDRAAGKPIDKTVNALNSLLGSANLKPAQKKKDDIEAELQKVPMGVWLYRFENKRPLPEIDEECKDVNHIRKYIFTWMGHLCKMLGLKNGYTKLYQNEIDRLRVERPEYDGDDDEAFMLNYMEGEEEARENEELLGLLELSGGDATDG